MKKILCLDNLPELRQQIAFTSKALLQNYTRKKCRTWNDWRTKALLEAEYTACKTALEMIRRENKL